MATEEFIGLVDKHLLAFRTLILAASDACLKESADEQALGDKQVYTVVDAMDNAIPSDTQMKYVIASMYCLVVHLLQEQEDHAKEMATKLAQDIQQIIDESMGVSR